MFNELESIDKYKAGTLRGQAVLELFSYLLKTGQGLGFRAWKVCRGIDKPGIFK